MPSSYSSSSESSRSPSPKCRVLRVSPLTPNVNRNHLYEIFENYGEVKTVSLAEKEGKFGVVKKGFAFVEMERGSAAQDAKECMDRGWIDGRLVAVSFVGRRKRKNNRSRSSRRTTSSRQLI